MVIPELVTKNHCDEPVGVTFNDPAPEYFIDVSGVDVNITGDNTNGLLTLMYPDQRI